MYSDTKATTPASAGRKAATEAVPTAKPLHSPSVALPVPGSEQDRAPPSVT